MIDPLFIEKNLAFWTTFLSINAKSAVDNKTWSKSWISEITFSLIFSSNSEKISSKINIGLASTIFFISSASDNFRESDIILDWPLDAVIEAGEPLKYIPKSSLWGPRVVFLWSISLALFFPKEFAKKSNIDLSFFQSNIEGELVEEIQKARKTYNGLIINAGAYTHTSIAIFDALKILNIPIIELHITNIYNREDFRHKSLISKVASGVICGFGAEGYLMALRAIKTFWNNENR